MNKETNKVPCKCSSCEKATNSAAEKREEEESEIRIANLRQISAQMEAVSAKASQILEAEALEQAKLRSKIAKIENQRDIHLEERKRRSSK